MIRHLLLFLFLLTQASQLAGLTSDGVLLLSFKYAVLSDPLSLLDSWNYDDHTPCSWNGVTCGAATDKLRASRVTGLVLPGGRISAAVPPDLGLIEHLRHLDLSGNFLNGSLPAQLFNASELRVLSLANNALAGKLPELVGSLRSLESLNLSNNAFAGRIPASLGTLPNLTLLSLSNNYFSGDVPAGFRNAEVLDFASNLLNGSLESNITAEGLKFLNLAGNRFSGEISRVFAANIPAKAAVDLSFNNFTGEIPEGLSGQKEGSFAGNPDLCGKPLKNPCSIPSTLSDSQNGSNSNSNSDSDSDSDSDSSPAIAVIPKTLAVPAVGSSVADAGPGPTTQQQRQRGMKPGVIAGIVVGDLAGIGILAVGFLYVYNIVKRKKKKLVETSVAENKEIKKSGGGTGATHERASPELTGLRWPCLQSKGAAEEEETSETTGSDSGEDEHHQLKQQQKGTLVTLDGDLELEIETLLKASAYILGATGSSIVYKAVLEDGTSLAVRRIGETAFTRLRDFENHVRLYAKLRHPNLVRIRGFYWGDDEKLLIYDYVSYGSLASVSFKKMGSSPFRLSWEQRRRIACGVARGLAFLHEKKYVHGNLKPSNILLGVDMEPKIRDFGLERLLSNDNSSKVSGSARYFGSKRSTVPRDSLQEGLGSVGAGTSSSNFGGSSYHAPESLKFVKPNAKWDVYSFGIVILELISGKVFSDKELSQWNTGFIAEDKIRPVLRMVDAGLRSEVEGKEEALLAWFKLGFTCASALPQRRPSMKEALQVLERIPSSHSSSKY